MALVVADNRLCRLLVASQDRCEQVRCLLLHLLSGAVDGHVEGADIQFEHGFGDCGQMLLRHVALSSAPSD